MSVRHRIQVTAPLIHPKMSSIGYGNPRYNSMMAYEQNLLLTCGNHLRLINRKNQILKQEAIGCSQIFQVIPGGQFILVVNFDGLVSLVHWYQLKVWYQFQAIGKQIRHSAISSNYIAVSCELNEGSEKSVVEVYAMKDIIEKNYKPRESFKGHFYYPELQGDSLVLVEYSDPNPKGKPRHETVLLPKLPITNRVVKYNVATMAEEFIAEIPEKGEIICAAQSAGSIYYLHNTKQITVYNITQNCLRTVSIDTRGLPHLLEPYKEGVVLVSAANTLLYVSATGSEAIPVVSEAIGGCLSLKFTEDGDIYSYNEAGLHCYESASKSTYTYGLFSITNCGVSIQDKLFAVGDFGGNVFVFSTEDNGIPKPLCSVCVGMPIRSLVLCKDKVVLGCVGGSLFEWKLDQQAPTIIQQLQHTPNIIRAKHGKIFVGISDGYVRVYDQATLKLLKAFKAHHAINYEDEKSKQLFGSMKNYAQIWSLAVSPHSGDYLVTCSEDQTERVFSISEETKEKKVLTGHELAVTSVDWKMMNGDQIYVSCSDDKIVRVRDGNFEVTDELQTSTIKEWHTLTYLCLEEGGSRVAVGSQNGYVFIYDLLKKELQYAEKVHLGGVEGMDWQRGRLITCSSDMCINIMHF